MQVSTNAGAGQRAGERCFVQHSALPTEAADAWTNVGAFGWYYLLSEGASHVYQLPSQWPEAALEGLWSQQLQRT